MEHQKETPYLKLLEAKLKVAIGCTEPIAIALATATAMANSLGKEVRSLRISASGNIIKNAMAVTIPGTKDSGILLAGALGLLSAEDAALGLEVLQGVDGKRLEKAKELVASGGISLELADVPEKLYIHVILETEVDQVEVLIEKEHANITSIQVDGKQILSQRGKPEQHSSEPLFQDITLEGALRFVREVDLEKLSWIRESIRLNRSIGEEGLKNPYGLEVGRSRRKRIDQGVLGEDILNHAVALTSAGTDARMSGALYAVMSNSGSGNQGITATLPVVAVGDLLGVGEEETIRGVALSNLVAILVKKDFGVLSALCGATVAATGAACGIVYLLGGGLPEMEMSIKNMLGNVSGILCDGAKPGCALKVGTVTAGAVNAALMAMDGLFVGGSEGIVADSAEDSIANFCRISREASLPLDQLILDIMVKKA